MAHLPLRRALAVSCCLAVAALAGCADGGSDASAAGGELVEVTMDEMSFTPDHFEFQVGDTVTFRFHNEGEVRHEAVIGDEAAQAAAMAAMAAMADGSTTTSTPPGDEGARGRSRAVVGHPGMGLPNLISVEPGRSGDITFQFAKPATLYMECHETGHLEHGMRATIVVTAA